MKLGVRQLARGAARIDDACGIASDYSFDIPYPMSQIESVVHELGHAYFLGKPRCSSDYISEELGWMDPEDRNLNEAKTLAAESVAMDLLGVKVDMHFLIMRADRNHAIEHGSGEAWVAYVRSFAEDPEVQRVGRLIARRLQWWARR